MSPSALAIRQAILRIAHQSGHGHIPTCFSVVEMLLAVYEIMRHDPANPAWPERDLFVLSKGHAALAHYCTLAQLGYFPMEDVVSFGAFRSSFGCHADRFKVPGVEVSTGSLGHGIGVAVGMALALKIDRSPRRVFVLVGDGAFQMTGLELSTAARLGLNPIVIVLNNRGYSTERQIADGPFNDIQEWAYHKTPELLGAGWGFVVETVSDLDKAMEASLANKDTFSILDVRLDPYDRSPALARLGEKLGKKV